MNRRQLRLVRLLFIILMLLLAIFWVLSSERLRQQRYPDNSVPNTEHIPDEDITATPSETVPTSSPDFPLATPTPPPSGKPADLFDVTGSNPHTTLFQVSRLNSEISTDDIIYSNYHNGVKTLYLETGTLSFTDDGYYTFTGTDLVTHKYRISDYIDFRELFSGLSSASEGDWFFLGALETKDYIYVSYDFWSVDELTLFFRMDKTGLDVSLVYATRYDELQNQGIFTASNEYLFYFYSTRDTQTGAIEVSLMQAEADGSKSTILLPLSDGYSAHHLTLTENAIIFMVTDPQGITSLVRMNTLNQELTYITEKCRATDYLYLYQDYACVGKSGSSLVFYQLSTCTEILVPLGDAASNSLGFPVCNNTQFYLQYFRWKASSDTTLLHIDPLTRTAESVTLISKELRYVTGITDDSLYAEANGSYNRYPLP